LSKAGFACLKQCREVTRQAIERFHIKPPQVHRQVATLSGGNAQKVLLARAVLANPCVLILDQPTAGVDIGAKAELHRQIREQAQKGVAILLISDDLDELLDMSDRLVTIVSGAIHHETRGAISNRSQLLAAISRHTPIV